MGCILTTWSNETNSEKLIRLRRELQRAQSSLVEAEKDLIEQQAEIDRLEKRLKLRLGRLMERLDRLIDEIEDYQQQIRRRRNQEAYDAGYLPVEDQFRQAWESSSSQIGKPKPDSTGEVKEKQIKRLYRQLARRYHPDLANDEQDLEFRTERMTALNEAYAAGSMIELLTLGSEAEAGVWGRPDANHTQVQMIEVVEKELQRIRKRMHQIQVEKENLHHHPSVQLSLEVKLARRNDRDLLGEMAAELKLKIAQKTRERDFLKAQLER